MEQAVESPHSCTGVSVPPVCPRCRDRRSSNSTRSLVPMTYRHQICCFVFVLAAASASAAFAASTSAAQAARLVSAITHGSVHLVSTFPGPAPNIIGVIGENKAGKKLMAWMVDGDYLATGPLFSAAGENLSLTAAEDRGLVVKPLSPQKLAQAGMAATGFTVGRRGPLMLAFEDPNCIFCNKLTLDAAPLIAAGKLRLRVLPVGFLKTTSARKSAAILSAGDPARAWEQNETKFDVATEEGAIAPASKTSPMLAVVKANTSLLAKSGTMATPTIVFCPQGKSTPEIVHGITPDWLAKNAAEAWNVTKEGGCAAQH